MLLPRANMCLVVHLVDPSKSVYIDPRMFSVWVQARNLKEYIILSVNKKKFCEAVKFRSKDPERMQIELIQRLREDWRRSYPNRKPKIGGESEFTGGPPSLQ
jgi:hypothetical protein